MKYVESDYIEKEADILELDEEALVFYHDHMHIYWKQIEAGQEFGWTFKEVYILHKLIVIEMMKRGLGHLHPINELDEIIFASNKLEFQQILNYIMG